MKKLRIILTISIFLFVSFSCEEALVEKPKKVAIENYYNTNDELETGIRAIYVPIKNVNCMGGRYPSLLTSLADYTKNRGSNASISQYQGFDATNITRVSNMWKFFYLSIRNANLVIREAPNATEVSESDIDMYIGEAKFMRALIYFIMVRNWGGLPLRTEENYEELSVPRSSVDEVYQLIIEDLLFAEDNLPDNPPVSGRADKSAAKTVLADVYFYRGEYSDATSKALEVIDSDKYTLVEIDEPEDFHEKLFGPEVINTTEEIFYLKYNKESGWGYPIWNHDPTVCLAAGCRGYKLEFSDTELPFMKNWNKNDFRYQYDFYPFEFGFGSNTILCKKWKDEDDSGDCGNDYPLYRYADLLLLYAEAACRVAGNPTEDAMEKLNMIHRRAYGKNPLVPSDIDFNINDYDKDSFINLVIRERGYELMWEGKRWLDINRLGKDKVREMLQEEQGLEIAEKHFLFPIPSEEIEYNLEIDTEDQNPGY